MSELDRQRLFDLVRHQRHALLETGLITQKEFVEILSGGERPPNGSVARLESYDEMRQCIATLEQQLSDSDQFKRHYKKRLEIVESKLTAAKEMIGALERRLQPRYSEETLYEKGIER